MPSDALPVSLTEKELAERKEYRVRLAEDLKKQEVDLVDFKQKVQDYDKGTLDTGKYDFTPDQLRIIIEIIREYVPVLNKKVEEMRKQLDDVDLQIQERRF